MGQDYDYDGKLHGVQKTLTTRGIILAVIGLATAILLKPVAALATGAALIGAGGIFLFSAGAVKMDLNRAAREKLEAETGSSVDDEYYTIAPPARKTPLQKVKGLFFSNTSATAHTSTANPNPELRPTRRAKR